MTPERHKWWDSLPEEEKRVRSFIAAEKSTIKVAKATINSKDCDVDYEKNAIGASKQLLKLLRKQIAQYPYRKDTHRVHCPNCWVWIVECYNEPPYCKYCGQKLRW